MTLDPPLIPPLEPLFMLRLLSLSALMLCLAGISQAAKPEAIFNGKNLEGWTVVTEPKHQAKTKVTPEENWVVQDGVIVTKGKLFCYLGTKKSFSNYKFQFDWRYPEGSTPDSNSGALIHMQAPLDRVFPKSLEPQGRFKDHGKIFPMGGLKVKDNQFDQKALDEVRKPIGQWNTTRIECDKNGGVVVFVNNKKVASCSSELKEGPVGFQSEGHEIHFRNITIEQID